MGITAFSSSTALTQSAFGTDWICVERDAFVSPDPGEVPYGMQVVRRDRSANAMMAPTEPHPAGENA